VCRTERERERVALLSAREHEVLVLIERNHTNPEIAELLYISLDTVKSHVANILAILEAPNRGEAARIYRSVITRSG
jgi:DNA-binding CsgD family transcriptional regulator